MSISAQRFATKARTWLFIAALTALLIGIGVLIGGVFLYVFVALAIVTNVVGYWFSDRIALRASGAKPVEPGTMPELEATVQDLAQRAQVPVPRLYTIPSEQPNAFATGRNPQHAAVAVTEGLLQQLPPEQVKGVLAHEFGHIKNRDILVSSIAAMVSGAIAAIANVLQFSLLFGGDDEDSGPLGWIGLIATIIFAPLAASLLQLAVSRQREYLADATGAELLGRAEPLADALETLERRAQAVPTRSQPGDGVPLHRQPAEQTGHRDALLHPPADRRARTQAPSVRRRSDVSPGRVAEAESAVGRKSPEWPSRPTIAHAETPPPPPRGSSPAPPPRPWYRPSPRWIAFFLAVLALDLFITSRAMEPESRARVPYSPFFLQQVTGGKRRGDHLEGDGYPGHVHAMRCTFEDSEPTTRFRTEIPAFADTDELSRVLQKNDVTVNAEPLDTGAPWWQTLLFGFGPTILFVLLLVWLFRRARNVQNAARLVRTVACARYEPSGDKVTFADVAGIEEVEGRAERGRRLPPQPGQVPQARRPDPARRAAFRAARHGQDAARARGRRRGGRSVLLDGRIRVRRGDRRSRRRARARPLQGGEGERSGDRVHRRAGRNRPLAHERRGRLQRRQRRAGADPQPDPDRDGRLRLGDERDRDRSDEPTRRARPGTPSAGAVRPPRRSSATRP